MTQYTVKINNCGASPNPLNVNLGDQVEWHFNLHAVLG